MKSKKKKTQVKQKVGRKWFDAENEQAVVAKLEHAWSLGCNDRQAILFANIGKDSYYRYLNAHPEISERKEMLKETPILLARTTVVEAIKVNPGIAMQYLERRQKDEFSPRQEVQHDLPKGFSLKITADDESNTMGTDEETGGGVAVPNR